MRVRVRISVYGSMCEIVYVMSEFRRAWACLASMCLCAHELIPRARVMMRYCVHACMVSSAHVPIITTSIVASVIVVICLIE